MEIAESGPSARISSDRAAGKRLFSASHSPQCALLQPNGDQRFRCALCSKTYSARCACGLVRLTRPRRAFGRHIDEGVCLRAQGKTCKRKTTENSADEGQKHKRPKLSLEEQLRVDVKTLLRIVKTLSTTMAVRKRAMLDEAVSQ